MTNQQIKEKLLEIVEALEHNQYDDTTLEQSIAIGQARMHAADAALILESKFPS